MANLRGASLIEVIRRRAKRAATPSCSTTARSCGTTASSGNAWRPRRASSRRQARQADRATASATPKRCSQKLQEEAVNHFASGWAWLVLDRGQLRITSLHDADTPLVHDGMVPLFTLDVWEHAYYIDYRNERPKFATAVLSNIVNWDFVAENLDGTRLRARRPGRAQGAQLRPSLLLEAVAGAEHPGDHRHAEGDDRRW